MVPFSLLSSWVKVGEEVIMGDIRPLPQSTNMAGFAS